MGVHGGIPFQICAPPNFGVVLSFIHNDLNVVPVLMLFVPMCFLLDGPVNTLTSLCVFSEFISSIESSETKQVMYSEDL